MFKTSQLMQYPLILRLKWKMHLHQRSSYAMTNIAENSKVRMSRYLDTSTEAQMAKIMVQYGRPSRTSWAESVRSSFGRTIMGKAIRESSILKYVWEKVPNWECLFVARNRTSIRFGNTHERRWFVRTDIIPWPCLFGLHSKKMYNK